MERQILLHCGTDGTHLLRVDDMVITNLREALTGADGCGAMAVIIIGIMDEITRWRANWRGRINDDEFQEIHDRLSPTPAVYTRLGGTPRSRRTGNNPNGRIHEAGPAHSADGQDMPQPAVGEVLRPAC